jgi:hypothetical protein
VASLIGGWWPPPLVGSDGASVVLPIRSRGDEDGRVVGITVVVARLFVAVHLAQRVTHRLDGLPLQPQPDMRIDVRRSIDLRVAKEILDDDKLDAPFQ